MAEPLPIVFIPGLMNSARLYGEQIQVAWRYGPVFIADHRQDDTVAGIARRTLALAPPRFALVGLSMGGYVAFEILRQAGDRVARLALLDTSARPDAPEQTARRRELIALAESGRFAELLDIHFPLFVARRRHGDERLKQLLRSMSEDTGADAYVRQQKAIMTRPDSRPGLAAIGCFTLVLVGADDELTPRPLAEEMAGGIRNSELVVVPDCGHLAPIEQPEAVTAALARWLDGTRA